MVETAWRFTTSTPLENIFYHCALLFQFSEENKEFKTKNIDDSFADSVIILKREREKKDTVEMQFGRQLNDRWSPRYRLD